MNPGNGAKRSAFHYSLTLPHILSILHKLLILLLTYYHLMPKSISVIRTETAHQLLPPVLRSGDLATK